MHGPLYYGSGTVSDGRGEVLTWVFGYWYGHGIVIPIQPRLMKSMGIWNNSRTNDPLDQRKGCERRRERQREQGEAEGDRGKVGRS